MNPDFRKLVLQIHAGDKNNLPYLYHLCNHAHGPELLQTLQRKSLVGKVLTEFIFEKCHGEPLKFLKWTIKETLKVNSPKSPKVLNNGMYK